MQDHILNLAKFIEEVQHIHLRSTEVSRGVNGEAVKAEYKSHFFNTNNEEIEKYREYFKREKYNEVIRRLNHKESEQLHDELKDPKILFTKYLRTLTELTNEFQFFVDQQFSDVVEKFYRLCEDKNATQYDQSIKNLIRLLKKHGDAQSTKPIFALYSYFEVPQTPFDNIGWLNLVTKSKKNTLKLLAKAEKIETLGRAPQDYENAFDLGIKQFYKLEPHIACTNNIDRNNLRAFLKLSICHGVDEEFVHEALNYHLKSNDKLPDIIVEGSLISHDLAKYYMRKFPHTDLQGYLLGYLSHSCQSIDMESTYSLVIDCMTKETHGFYAIYERSNNTQDNEDKLVAQSIVWLGDKNDDASLTLVFDSWERVDTRHDKLLDSFYSKFAEIVKSDTTLNIGKISLGIGGKTPKSIYVPYRIESDAMLTTLDGQIPHHDSKAQYVIFDKNRAYHPYDEETNKKRGIGVDFKKIVAQLKKEEYNGDQIKSLFDTVYSMNDSETRKLVLTYDILEHIADLISEELFHDIIKNIILPKTNIDAIALILGNALEEKQYISISTNFILYMLPHIPIKQHVEALNTAVCNENTALAIKMLQVIRKQTPNAMGKLLGGDAMRKCYYELLSFLIRNASPGEVSTETKFQIWCYMQELDIEGSIELTTLLSLLQEQVQDVSQQDQETLILSAAESNDLKQALHILNKHREDLSDEINEKIESAASNAASLSMIGWIDQTIDTDTSVSSNYNDNNADVVGLAALPKEHQNTQHILGNKGYISIPGIPDTFSYYYQDRISLLLKLRLEDAKPEVLKAVNVLEEHDTLRKDNEDYVAAKLSLFILASEKDTILMPLNIGGSHLVGIAVVKDGNKIALNYMDSELGLPSESFILKIGAMLEPHSYTMELRIVAVEEQKYSNCGPEVIENLTSFATGKPRVSQEDAILKHSLVLERYLLKDFDHSSQPDPSTSAAIFSGASALNEKLVAQVQHYLNTGEAFDSARAAIEDGTVSIIRQPAVVSDEAVPNAITPLSMQTYSEDLYHTAESFPDINMVAIVGLLCSFVVSSENQI